MEIKILALGILLVSAAALEAKTYMYRVPAGAKTKIQFRQEADAVGIKDPGQPFFQSQLLKGNTTHDILQVTPADGKDPKFEKIYGYDPYKVLDIDEEGFIRAIVDKSKQFPVFPYDFPVAVEISSGTKQDPLKP